MLQKHGRVDVAKMSSKIISRLDCFDKINELSKEYSYASKRQKLDTFENCKEVLESFDVSITEIPVEKENREKWQSEKRKLMKAFGKVLTEKKTYERKPTSYKIEGIFYKSNDYKLLTSIAEPSTSSMVL